MPDFARAVGEERDVREVSDVDKGIFWCFVAARVDPPTLKFLVAEAFGVSVAHLNIAWPGYRDEPLGIASLRVAKLRSGQFRFVVDVSSLHTPPVKYAEFGQRMSTAMKTEILLDGGTPNYAWMILVTPTDPPRRVCMTSRALRRNIYVIAPNAGPEENPVMSPEYSLD